MNSDKSIIKIIIIIIMAAKSNKETSTLASYGEVVKLRAARYCSFCSLMERDLL